MKSNKITTNQIEECLIEKGPMTTHQMLDMFGCSRATLYLRLREIPNISSCNQNGKYHAHLNRVEFDHNGLWHHQEIVFSKWGNIINTIQHLVDLSEAGLATSMLNSLLKTNVTPQIVSMVKTNRIYRKRFGRYQFHFSPDIETRIAQIKMRKSMIPRKKEKEISVPNKKLISILISIVRHHAVTEENAKKLLDADGIVVSDKELHGIFTKYDIKKKVSP